MKPPRPRASLSLVAPPILQNTMLDWHSGVGVDVDPVHPMQCYTPLWTGQDVADLAPATYVDMRLCCDEEEAEKIARDLWGMTLRVGVRVLGLAQKEPPAEITKKFKKIEKHIEGILNELGYPWPPNDTKNPGSKSYDRINDHTLLLSDRLSRDAQEMLNTMTLPAYLASIGDAAHYLTKAKFSTKGITTLEDIKMELYGGMMAAFQNAFLTAPGDLFLKGERNPDSLAVEWCRRIMERTEKKLGACLVQDQPLVTEFFRKMDAPTTMVKWIQTVLPTIKPLPVWD